MRQPFGEWHFAQSLPRPPLCTSSRCMAGVAVAADVLVRARHVALLARHGDVQPDQREIGQVVIEAHAAQPSFRRVAAGAIGAELAGVHIARAVAADAVRGSF